MLTQQHEQETFFKEDGSHYFEQILEPIQNFQHKFNALLYKTALFHAGSWALIIAEIFFFIFTFTLLYNSSLLALGLALIFFTLFGYFIFKLNVQTAKLDRIEILVQNYLQECNDRFPKNLQIGEPHILLAQACSRLAQSLKHQEKNLFSPPPGLYFLKPTFEKISQWWNWTDFHLIQERLLTASAQELISLIRSFPTRLDFHAALANAYILLANLYATTHQDDAKPKTISRLFRKKYQSMQQKALQEFKIISQFTPHDPWIHLQLAYTYRDLELPQKEIRQYETLLKLAPTDTETLYKLGTLYFQEGLTAKGLCIYQKLKEVDEHKALKLIRLYN